MSFKFSYVKKYQRSGINSRKFDTTANDTVSKKIQ